MRNKKQILGRESIRFDDIYEAYYSGTELGKEYVLEILSHIASEFNVPLEKLRPSDRFESELAPEFGNAWDSAGAILMHEILWKYKRKRMKAGRIETIDDYIKAMAIVY